MAIVYYEACALSSNMSKRYNSERKYERQKTKLNYYKEGEMFESESCIIIYVLVRAVRQ
jgi:hypothetical protein